MLSLLLASLIPSLPARSEALPLPQAGAGGVSWIEGGIDEARAKATEAGRMLLAFFVSAKDETSQTMLRTVFADERVVSSLANVACVRVDVDQDGPIAYRYAVKKVPAVVWFNADGTPRDRTDGPRDPDAFRADLARIQADLGTINEVRRKVASDKSNTDLRFELYRRLQAVGDLSGAREQRVAIERIDPAGESRAQRHFRYEEITQEIERHWAQTGALLMPKVEELRAFVELQTDSELVWDGWMRLANTHAYLADQAAKAGNDAEAKSHRSVRRECVARAWRGIPDGDRPLVFDWCHDYGHLFWDQRDELSEADRSFLETMSLRMVQVFEQEPIAFEVRALALKIQGRLADAIAAAQHAVELAPGDAKYQELLREIQTP